jgi:rhodanese-related sulfurtransferase
MLTAINPTKAKEFFENKVSFTTGPVEVSKQIANKDTDIVIVDVREAQDYRAGHVPGAVNLPKERWQTFEGLNKEKTNVLYCYTQTCHLAAKAAVQFASHDYPVVEMDGGFKAWKESNLQIEK